jgi:hypothetical protein
VTLDISIASPEHRRRCLVIGSKMTLELRDGYDDRLFVREGFPGSEAAIAREIHVGTAMPLLTEVRRFVEFLQGGPKPYGTMDEAVLVVRRIAEIEEALALQHA